MVEAWGVEPQCSINIIKPSTCLDAFAISLAKGLHGASTCVLEPTYVSEESDITPKFDLRAYIVQLHLLLASMSLIGSNIVFA